MRASLTIRSMNAETSRSGMDVAQDRAHGGGNVGPLSALGRGLAAAFGRQAVVLARTPIVRLLPTRFQKTRPLHLMERGIERAFLQLKRLRAAAFGFLEDLIAVHLAFGEETQNEHADGAGEEFTVVVHIPC